MQHTEDGGNEKQCRDSRDQKATNDRPPERRILLAPFTQGERHRDHAQDHGTGGHQHGTETREPGVEGRGYRIIPCSSLSRAKLTRRTLFAVAIPMHMIAPVRAGMERVVPVTNSIQTMPASAPGRAVMMMNGSSHDWKLTTMIK